MLKAIIFDLGEVLFPNDWNFKDRALYEKKQTEYIEHFGIKEEEFQVAWKLHMGDFLRGNISEDEFWRRFLSGARKNHGDIDFAKKKWREYQKPKDGMLELVSSLSKHYVIGALTTISKEGLDFKMDTYKVVDPNGKERTLRSFFKAIVSSGYSGYMKPEAEVYELVEKEMGFKREEMLFIDDTQELLDAAKGFQTFLFRDIEGFKVFLKEEGIFPIK